jgi:hypothetical protein
MEVIKMSAKLYAPGAAVDGHEILAAFHRWIVAQGVPGHTWIDVADYSHVSGGPGIVLVGIEANVSFDQADGTWGIVYTRKQAWPGSLDLTGRIRETMRETAQCATMLAGDPVFAARLAFATDRFLIRLNDRLAAPNSERTLGQARAALTAAGETVWGEGVTIEHHPARLSLFEAILRGTTPVTLETVVGRLTTRPGTA